MELNDINGEWQREAPLLASVQKENPFTVPDSYFEELHQNMRRRIALEKIEQPARKPFVVPEGYFENLNARILSSVKISDLKDKAGESGFVVPAYYFDHLENNIISKTRPIGIKSLRQNKRWINYAAAACMAVVLGVGLLLNKQSNSLESKLSQVSDDEIVNYLQIHSDTGDFPAIVENSEINTVASKLDSALSEQEIERYLETTL